MLPSRAPQAILLALLVALLSASAAFADTTVTVTPDGLDPQSVTVDAGETVTFERWHTTGPWSVDADAFGSGDLSSEGAYSVSLSVPGTHAYTAGGETGEITVRGNVVMEGYYRDPEATARAFHGGWFHSGDAAVVHPDG